jgi:hypothetical protein
MRGNCGDHETIFVGVSHGQPDETDRLIAELRARDIGFFTGGHDQALAAEVISHPLAPSELLHQLPASNEPRVRDATIALLLLHPDLAEHLPATILPLEEASADQLIVLALAATYLQRRWRTRLTLALGPQPEVPARFWHAWNLPDPDGPPPESPECGLRALAVRERLRRGLPLNYLALWEQQVDHLVSQAWRARSTARGPVSEPLLEAVHPRRGASGGHAASRVTSDMPESSRYSGGALGMAHATRGGTRMSMRAPVDRERIERFLVRLGSMVHEPGRLYLVGGTTMVYEGFRATTVDIHVLVEADTPGAIIAAIRSLKDVLDMNVEFASPRDFIPLPAGWRERSIYVGRYAALDVFHFDLYSMALSKIERGTERDFQDVVALVSSGRLDPAELDTAFHEILPRIATEGLGSMDPDVFAEHYRYLRALLGPDCMD